MRFVKLYAKTNSCQRRIRIDEHFRVLYKLLMQELTVAQAAELLGISPRRVQQLIKAGRLPARQFAGAYVINKKDVSLVANRKPGRPANQASKIPRSRVPKDRTSNR